MTHWFDTFSKKAAGSHGMERRSFLAFGTVLGLGALNGGAKAADTPPGASARPPRVIPAGQPVTVQTALGSRVRRTVGSLVIHEIETEKSGVALKSALAFNRTTQNATISATITRGPDLVAKLDFAITKGGAGTISVYYGTGYAGVRSITASTKNGKTFQGTADGRPFTLAGNHAEFLDRGAPPQLIRDPAIAATIRSLDTQASGLLRVAPTAAPAPPKPRADLDLRVRPSPAAADCGPHRPPILAPGNDWYEPGDDPVDCSVCENDCGTNVGSWILDIFTFGASEPEYWAACMAACNLPDGGCLPTPCGFLTTCGKNDTCFSYEGGRLCCPSPSAICNGVCCGDFITSCGSDGTCGCPEGTNVCAQECCNPDQACCNGACCAKGQVCIDGICCKPGVVTCKGLCCDKGQVCHNGKCCKPQNMCGPTCCDELATCLNPETGVCCGFDQPVCGGVCCPLGAVCLNGKCCEPNSVCGGICCPGGHTCANPATHTCTACPDGKVACLSTNGIGMCCPPGVECCGTTCCSPGQVCQASGKTFICVAATPIQ
jgi:hypothetical protein